MDKAIRTMHTLQTHPEGVGSFVTLTYSPQQLPASGLLELADLQQFVKKLRHKVAPGLQYLAAGEYGSEAKGFRPHFHLCLIGYGSDAVGHDHLIQETWDKGITHRGHLTMASAMYTAKYIKKPVKEKPHYQPGHPNYTMDYSKSPEFSVQSSNPALGKRFIERYWSDVYATGFDAVVIGDQKYAAPRYYDRWLEKYKPRLWRSVVMDRTKNRNGNALDPSEADREYSAREQTATRNSEMFDTHKL